MKKKKSVKPAARKTVRRKAAPAPEPCLPPQPGPQHAELARHAGVWDAAVTMYMDPAAPPAQSTGEQRCRMMGAFWLISEHIGDFGGMPFEGHEITGYDSRQKKYVAVWADSFGDWMMSFTGTARKGGQGLDMTSRAPGMDGKPANWKTSHIWKDDDQRNWKMWVQGKNKRWSLVMEIAYTRRRG